MSAVLAIETKVSADSAPALSLLKYSKPYIFRDEEKCLYYVLRLVFFDGRISRREFYVQKLGTWTKKQDAATSYQTSAEASIGHLKATI